MTKKLIRVTVCFSLFTTQSILTQDHLNFDAFKHRLKVRYTGEYAFMYTLKANFFSFFDVHQQDILLYYFNRFYTLKNRANNATKPILRNMLNNQRYNLFMLSEQTVLLQRLLLKKSKKVVTSGLNGVPTEFAIIYNGKIQIHSQVEGAVILLPILGLKSLYFNAIGDWRGAANAKPLFKINQAGKVTQTIQIENKTPRKGYHLYDLDLVTLLGKQQYLITNQYSKDSRCVRAYLEFKVLDVPRKTFDRTKVYDLCKKNPELENKDEHEIIYRRSAHVRGIKYDFSSKKLAVLLYKGIISKTKKIRRKQTNTAHL